MTEQKRSGIRVSLYSLILGAFLIGSLELGLAVLYFQQSSAEPLALVHYLRKTGSYWEQLLQLTGIRKPTGIWQDDERYGFSHIPESAGIHETKDFKVTYTIDAGQGRAIPQPTDALGRILFVGGSVTFGHGVNDDENFPYLLATNYWNNWGVENRAVMAWGTAHAYMVVSDEFDGEDPPSAVIYVMIPHHIQRNYIRRSWLKLLDRAQRRHPHFEIVDGALQFKGVIGVEEGEADSEIRKKELELTKAFLRGMHDLCKQHQVPFIVVLKGKPSSWPPSVIMMLDENNIPMLDLSEMHQVGFPHDKHPNSSDHQNIAGAIANSFITDILSELASERHSK